MTKSKTVSSLLLVGILSSAFFSGTTLAQTEGLKFGANTIVTFDDNIFREQEKESDTILRFSPNIAYIGLYGKNRLVASYDGEYASFSDNSDINYTNHTGKAELDLDITSRLSATVGILYFQKVEEPGTNNRELNDALNFTKVDSFRTNLETAYGTKESIGQFVLKYVNQEFDYSNNNQEFRDRTINDLTGTFFWRVAAKSRMILEVRVADVESDNTTGFNQSFQQISYLTGLTWDATAKTDGSLRIGYQDTQFENPLIADLDGLSFFLDVDYRPDTDSLVNVSLSRTARDNAELVLAGLETTDFSVSWKNRLATKTALELEYRYRQDKFGGGDNTRKDDTNRIIAELSYVTFDWLNLYTNIDYMVRDSGRPIYEFDNKRISIGVEITFD